MLIVSHVTIPKSGDHLFHAVFECPPGCEAQHVGDLREIDSVIAKICPGAHIGNFRCWNERLDDLCRIFQTVILFVRTGIEYLRMNKRRRRLDGFHQG